MLGLEPAPTFTWTYDGADMAKYYVQFSNTPNYASGSSYTVVYPGSGTKNLFYTPNSTQWKNIKKLAVDTGGLIYWRVKGVDASGAFALWSPTRTFTLSGGTITLLPPVPDGDRTVPYDAGSPRFSWEYAGTDYVKFYLQLSVTPDFGPSAPGVTTMFLPASGVKGTTVTLNARVWDKVQDLSPGGSGTIYWRLKAVDADNAFYVLTPPEFFVWR